MDKIKDAIRNVLNEHLDRWKDEKKTEDEILAMLSENVQQKFSYRLKSDELKKAIIEVSVEFKPPTISVSIVDGGVQVNASKPMDNVQILGILEMGKAQVLSGMIDDKNKRIITQN